MGTDLESLAVLERAGNVSDAIWRRVVLWEPLAREVVGGQLARAADSIGANIAEAFGCFHYGDKLQFLYYARGSLFETKYWLNRALQRQLLAPDDVRDYSSELNILARQINAFAASLKQQRHNAHHTTEVREHAEEFRLHPSPTPFTENDLHWLRTEIGD